MSTTGNVVVPAPLPQSEEEAKNAEMEALAGSGAPAAGGAGAAAPYRDDPTAMADDDNQANNNNEFYPHDDPNDPGYDPAADIASYYPEKVGRVVRRKNKQRQILYLEWGLFVMSLVVFAVGCWLQRDAKLRKQRICHLKAVGAASRRGINGTAGYNWMIQGDEIFGPLANNAGDGATKFAHAVQISSDGTRLAVAITTPIGQDDSGVTTGVQVHDWDGNTWVTDVTLEATVGDAPGEAVHDGEAHPALDMSMDGKRIAFSHHDIVYVYERQQGEGGKGHAWNVIQKLEYPNQESFGTSVAFAPHGDFLAVTGEVGGSSDHLGYCNVYKYFKADKEFRQVGKDIIGNRFGGAVALNELGTVVAVGTVGGATTTIQSWSGVVRVFQRDESSAMGWTQIGTALPGSPYAGTIGLSARGETLALASIQGNGEYFVSVYRWIQHAKAGGVWEPYGSTLTGDSDLEKFGASLAMSRDGTVLVIGAPGSPREILDTNALNGNTNKYMYGRSYVFQFGRNTREWELVGDVILGGGRADQFGYAVAITEYGTKVAIGAPTRNVGDLMNVGGATVYSWEEI